MAGSAEEAVAKKMMEKSELPFNDGYLSPSKRSRIRKPI
jgi:hypothetical protein